MPALVKSRTYDSTSRQAAARQTRRRILTAARELFIARGYAATTIRAIAEAAGVAWQTVYLAFGTKAAILSAAYDVAVAGDDEPVAIPDREFHRRTLGDPDPRKLIAGFVHFAAHAGARTAPLFAVLEQAAPSSPELASLLDKVREERLQGMERVAHALKARGALRGNVSEARDVLYLLTGPAAIGILVAERGWTPEQAELWLVQALSKVLLVSASSRPARR